MESLNDVKAYVLFLRRGAFQRSPIYSIQSSYIFKGAENPLVMSRVYSEDFICKFNMRNYPFDTQKCSLIFETKGEENPLVIKVYNAKAIIPCIFP